MVKPKKTSKPVRKTASKPRKPKDCMKLVMDGEMRLESFENGKLVDSQPLDSLMVLKVLRNVLERVIEEYCDGHE